MSNRLCFHKTFVVLYGAQMFLWFPKNLAFCDELYLVLHKVVVCRKACFGCIRIWVIQIEGVLSAHNQSSLWCCSALAMGYVPVSMNDRMCMMRDNTGKKEPSVCCTRLCCYATMSVVLVISCACVAVIRLYLMLHKVVVCRKACFGCIRIWVSDGRDGRSRRGRQGTRRR